MGVYVYLEGYGQSNFGRGAAISVLMLGIVIAMTAFYVRAMVKMGEVD
jgi:ABC-type sugar transport system permease subunit